MKVFIKGIGNISPQNTVDNNLFLEDIVEHQGNQLNCIEPNYKEYVSPGLARRMSRIIKMGVTAARICLKDANIEIPDAIITGTGLGCLQDTEKFLTSIIKENEQLLSPTPFIQSTHNVISSQIALLLQCNKYNQSFVHRGFSFESALLDGMMLLEEKTAKDVLVGGVDEISQSYFEITRRLGHWKNISLTNLELLKHKTRGSIAGEGAVFFLLSNDELSYNYAQLSSIRTFYKPDNLSDITDNTTQFINDAGIDLQEIDLVILGLNGDPKFDAPYHHLINNYFKDNSIAYYKHLCGEYQTSTSFALWLGTNIIKRQTIPDVIKLQYGRSTPVKNILVYNHYRNINHSLFLITAC